ncbi:DUF805 domain-containing protein [Enterococcus faecalis]|nr:DUF805 domain-containing protein [Enterococcus faecalis]EIP8061909.1 DUF805 domain-containing protein [Enterococcus faecalis]EKZ0111279.1 DUF805 domain-containing protein [Enterococcus faecalis]
MAKIEQKGKVTFRQAIKDFFRGYVDFKGRTTRAGYWWASLALIIVAIVTAIMFFFGLFANNMNGSIPMLLPFIIFVLVAFIPNISMSVRRYRDVGLTGWGTLCLWIVYFLLSQINYNYGWDSVAEEIVFSTNPMITFVTAIINIFMVLLTIFPTDMLTVSSENRILRFFFRPVNKEDKED